jgi:outer membrane protein assembly factor BamB
MRLAVPAPRQLLQLLLVLAAPVGPARGDDWPQWLGPQRDGVWRETGILDRFPKGGPKVRWRAPVGGGYAGPAVADGKVFVLDRVLAPGQKEPASGFAAANTEGVERVLCLEEATGKTLWKHEYPCKYTGLAYGRGPRCTPVVAGGKVFTLGAMGDLYCLEGGSGKVLWSKNFPKDYGAPVPLWGFAAHPLLDGDRLICLVGGTGSVVVAFDKDTGKEKWKALAFEKQQTQLGYCPPMIYKAGGVRQLVIWHPEAVNGLDPETGKVYWSEKFLVRSNLTIPTPQLAGDKLLVSSFYNGSRLYQLDADKPAAHQVWASKGRGESPKQTDNLHSIMATPFIRDGYIYGVCSYGELRCLKLEDGSRVWEDLRATGDKKEPEERWANAFLVPQGDRWFLFNEKGDLIIARLSPKGYEENDRAHILEPTNRLAGRSVVWSHPAFANRSMYVRNDQEIVCVWLGKE